MCSLASAIEKKLRSRQLCEEQGSMVESFGRDIERCVENRERFSKDLAGLKDVVLALENQASQHDTTLQKAEQNDGELARILAEMTDAAVLSCCCRTCLLTFSLTCFLSDPGRLLTSSASLSERCHSP